MKKLFFKGLSLTAMLAAPSAAYAVPVYLNESLINVSVGSGTTATSANNTFNGGQTINKVIDAPSATAEEFHNQTTHIWYSGGGLELLFDFNQEYDISTLHFWNYTGEGFDVDNIDFNFFDASSTEVGSLSIMPALGSSPGIKAEDIPLAAPLNVQFVSAFLTGSNNQVDFQNIGFTAQVSSPTPTPTPTPPTVIPLPAGLPLMLTGLLGIGVLTLRKKAA